MELPVNFIVLLILSILMFGTGIYILHEIMGGLDDLEERFLKQIEEEIEKSIMQGKLFQVGMVYKSIDPGQYGTFSVGIQNQMAVEKAFHVEGSCVLVTGPDKTLRCDETAAPGSCSFCDGWLYESEQKIKAGGHEIWRLHVRVPVDADKGIYHYSVRACQDNPCSNGGTRLDTAKILMITVV